MLRAGDKQLAIQLQCVRSALYCSSVLSLYCRQHLGQSPRDRALRRAAPRREQRLSDITCRFLSRTNIRLYHFSTWRTNFCRQYSVCYSRTSYWMNVRKWGYSLTYRDSENQFSFVCGCVWPIATKRYSYASS